MFSLVYASSASELFSKEELLGLLDQSRASNLAAGLTGMLLYKDGNFLQVLEGEKGQVMDLFERIKHDPRHRGVLPILCEEIPERRFGDWSMGFRDMKDSNLESIPGFSTFLNQPFTAQGFRAHPSRAQKLLEMFRRRM